MPKNVQVGDKVIEFPDDMADEAISAVLRKSNPSPTIAQSTPKYQQAPQGFTQNLVAPIPKIAAELYHNVMDAPRTPEEQAIKGTDASSGLIARALGQVGLGGYRTLLAPSVSNAKTGTQDLQQGNTGSAIADYLSAVPGVSQGVSMLAPIMSQFQQGDIKGATGSILGNALAMGIGAKLPGMISDIPSAAIAGRHLNTIASTVGKTAVPLGNESLAALQRLAELSENGGAGSVPPGVMQLINRSQRISPMVYPEARDYVSNISALSAAEKMASKPQVAAQVGELTSNLHGDIANAIGQYGPNYLDAIKEYARAQQMKQALKTAGKVAAGTGVAAVVGKGTYDLAKRMVGK